MDSPARSARWSAVPLSGRGRLAIAASDTENLLALFRALPVPVAIARVADSEIIYANHYFETTFALTAAPPDASHQLARFFEPAAWQVLLQALLQYRFLLNYELSLRRADQTSVWGLVSLQLLELAGEPIILGVFHDITYPRCLDQALQDNQRTLVALANDLAGTLYRCRLDAARSYEFLSAGAAQLTGYPADEFLSGRRSLRDLIVASDRPQVSAELDAAIAECRPYSFEYRLLTADQTVRWVWEQGSPLQESDGQPSGLQGLIADITDRKRVEEELQLLQTLTLAIAEAPDFESALALVLRRVCDQTEWLCGEVWLPDSEGRVLRRGAARYSRSDRAPAGARPLADFHAESDAYQFARGEGLPGRVWQERQACWLPDVSIEPSFCRAALARACGLHAGCGVPIPATDGVAAVLVFFLPVARSRDQRYLELIAAIAAQLGSAIQRKQTEAALQASERRLNRLLDDTPGIFFTGRNDANWSMSYLSAGCQALTGYPSETFIRDRGAFDRLIHPDDRARVLQAIDAGVAACQPYVIEYRLRDRQGREHWVWEKGRGVYDAGGQVLGVEGFISDITDRKQSEEAARAYAGELQALFAAMTDVILVLDADGRYCKIAPTSPELLYRSRDELQGKTVSEVFAPDKAEFFLQAIRQALASGQPLRTEYDIETPDRQVWFSATVSPTTEGTVVWVARDITDTKASQAALEAAEAKYRSIFENAIEGIFQTTVDGHYLSANPALARIYGYESPEELIASLTNIQDQLYVDPEQRAAFMQQVQTEGLVRGFEAQIYRRDGSRIWIAESARAVRDRAGNLLYYEGMVEDITAQKEAETELHLRAFYDPLTGLPNRALFQSRLSEATERVRQSKASDQFAVLFLDLDRFKVVNDSLGHLVGDQLLVAIARRLERCLREGDMVARLGGDEFTILLHRVTGIDDAVSVADRINAALALPFTLDGYQVFTGASIGIVLSREYQAAAESPALTPYQQPEDLLRDADTALYRAKALGKGRYELFDPAMHRQAIAQLQLETELRQAVERQEFALYYQPIVDLKTETLNGFEVLLRWRHPERGLLYPAEFMTLAEETGLLIPLGYWLLAQAGQQLAQWQARYPEAAHLVLEINCSTRQFFHPDLIAQLDQVCEQTGVRGANLRLAIAESLWSENAELVKLQLDQLHARQIQLGVDDFGAGYSRLHDLNQVPIDVLKIDRSFIHDIATDSSQAEIAQIAVLIAHKCGLAAVAEGVETAAQLQVVRELGCNFAQGYLFADAETASVAETWLKTGSWRLAAAAAGEAPDSDAGYRTPQPGDRSP